MIFFLGLLWFGGYFCGLSFEFGGGFVSLFGMGDFDECVRS